MSEIQIQQNSQSQNIVSRDGRLLCSPRNPVHEAQIWYSRQNLSNEDHNLLILGFGAGYHVQEVCRNHPKSNVFVLELDEETKSFANEYEFKFISTQNLKNKNFDAICPFRPAWQGFEKDYLSIFTELTPRMKFLIQNSQCSENELKIWQCLRELVI